MFDVCGIGEFRRREERDVFITHLDPDHLPLREYILGAPSRFYTAADIPPALRKRYGGSFEVAEYDDVLKLKHTTISNRRFVTKTAYAFFLKEAMIIPECDDPDALIREYSPKFTFLFVSYQSHNHLVKFNNHRRDVFILNNKVWRPHAPNVIPKIVFSCTREDREFYNRYIVGRRLSYSGEHIYKNRL